ncbi:MAG: hypothetical protein ACYC4L_15225 [Chloroflexota bacterium]
MLKDLIGLAGVPLIVALVEATKATVPGLDKRYYALLAVGWGLALNLLAAYALATPYLDGGVEGLVAGLAAAGLYSATKAALATRGAA